MDDLTPCICSYAGTRPIHAFVKVAIHSYFLSGFRHADKCLRRDKISMIRSPGHGANTVPVAFRARRVCALAFEEAIDDLYGRAAVTEMDFRDAWLAKIRQRQEMTASGWYSPPPLGAAVLAGTESSPQRIGFKSLRDPSFFPGNAHIDWNAGYLYAYCSNVSLETRFPGDFSTTLYFGQESHVREHFLGALNAARELASRSIEEESSLEVFRLGQSIMREHGLSNTVHSVTDIAPLDFGHSLSRIPSSTELHAYGLSPETCSLISRSRVFINEVSDWSLSGVDAYTIEPQMIATARSAMPKVTYHYLVSKSDGGVLEDSFERLVLRLLNRGASQHACHRKG